MQQCRFVFVPADDNRHQIIHHTSLMLLILAKQNVCYIIRPQYQNEPSTRKQMGPSASTVTDCVVYNRNKVAISTVLESECANVQRPP